MTASPTGAHPALRPFLEARLEARTEARSDPSGRASALTGVERCEALTAALDAGFRDLVAAMPSDGVAVVAVGGYGRREQCRHSDIDVMLLVEPGLEETAKRLLYPVWDTGLRVGHSIRTVSQVVEASRQNLETLTALLDARFVAGERSLFEAAEEAHRRYARGQHARVRRELAERRASLLAREPWQRQDVDVKAGRGGLRDLQVVRWLATIEAMADGAEALPAPPPLEEAREPLLATRHALHALSERPIDVFRTDLAPRAAAWLDADLLDWSRRLYLAMRDVDAAASAALSPDRRTPGRRWLFWRRPAEPAEPGRSAEEQRDVDRLFGAIRGLTDEEQGAPPLEPLPREEWLERLLPEWEVLRARRHIAPFHIHPVDVHSVRAMAEAAHAIRVDEDGTGTPAAAAELGDPSEVLLAALLHDIGKGHEAEHVAAGAVIAERFAARAGLSPEASERLVRAVRLHLLLPSVATRRDIADERVIRDVAEQVGDAQTLHLLYVLSVADARATGTDVWSAWKAQLLRALYVRTLEALSAASPDASTVREQRLRRVVEALATRFPAEVVESHVRGMEPGYLLSTPADTIGDHIALAQRLDGVPVARHDRLGDLDRLTVVTADRPGLLQAIAGALAGQNANVLGGVAYTRDDGVAIQVWHVDDALGVGIDERRWQRILDAVPRAVAGDYPIDERLAEVRDAYRSRPRPRLPTVVHVDNAASEAYTVLEVTTGDRLGLLYAITRALHDLGIDIHLAKVDTIGGEVVDAFYVRRESGRRIEDPDEIARLEHRVRDAIAALD